MNDEKTKEGQPREPQDSPALNPGGQVIPPHQLPVEEKNMGRIESQPEEPQVPAPDSSKFDQVATLEIQADKSQEQTDEKYITNQKSTKGPFSRDLDKLAFLADNLDSTFANLVSKLPGFRKEDNKGQEK
jgi:hypothetical protein